MTGRRVQFSIVVTCDKIMSPGEHRQGKWPARAAGLAGAVNEHHPSLLQLATDRHDGKLTWWVIAWGEVKVISISVCGGELLSGKISIQERTDCDDNEVLAYT